MRLLLLSIPFLLPTVLQAQDTNSHLCNYISPSKTRSNILSSLERPSDQRIYIHADTFEGTESDTLILEGDVQLLRTEDSLETDKLLIDDKHFIADSHITYRNNGDRIRAESAKLDQASDEGIFTGAEFFSAENHSTIQADQLVQFNSQQKTLSNVRYTTCEPDKPYWQMRAKSMDLNHETGRGLAKHMQLRLFNVPFFYFPAFSFPIDDRRLSGFLYPSFTNSDNSGTELTIPWYWNIAPQADATLTARHMSKRGLQANTEWRYLNRYGNNLFHSEHLNDKTTNQSRWLYHFNHTGKIHSRWETAIQSYNVGDPEHLDDLDSAHDTNSNYLKRFIELKGTYSAFNLSILTQDYEFADSAANDNDSPYELLPRISFSSGNAGAWDINKQFQSEYTQFDHPTLSDTGARWVNQLSAEKKFGNAGWFIKPRLNLHLSEYDTDNAGRSQRSVPITSIDSGLIFDRFTPSIQQTLEPRLYLLHVPFKEQSALPDYDTSAASSSFNQLFKETRFSGYDRVGDTRQASVGLTSRIYNQASGQETVRMQIGQSFFFADQRVNLDGSAADERRKSPIFTELNWSFAKYWSLKNNMEWSNSENDTRESRFSLQYQRDNRHLFYLSHNADNDSLEQIDVNGRWQFGTRWSVMGKYQYDLENNQNIHRFAGIEYENCCLALRLVQQEILESGEQRDNLYLQLSLKGLSTIGRLNRKVANGIFGYKDTFN